MNVPVRFEPHEAEGTLDAVSRGMSGAYVSHVRNALIPNENHFCISLGSRVGRTLLAQAMLEVVFRPVADDDAFDHVDNVFGDVCRVVGDPFDVPRHGKHVDQ